MSDFGRRYVWDLEAKLQSAESEVERQREELRQAIDGECSARDEVERLRAVLEDIAYSAEPSTAYCQEQARQALEAS